MKHKIVLMACFYLVGCSSHRKGDVPPPPASPDTPAAPVSNPAVGPGDTKATDVRRTEACEPAHSWEQLLKGDVADDALLDLFLRPVQSSWQAKIELALQGKLSCR